MKLTSNLSMKLILLVLIFGTAEAQDRAELRATAVQQSNVASAPIHLAQPKSMTGTPKAQRRYVGNATRLSEGENPPKYTCDYDQAGKPVSCWCNWSKDAADCAAFALTNPCGNDACWTSNVPGEYGCDCQN